MQTERNEEDLTAPGEALITNCELSRRRARLGGGAGTEGNGSVSDRRDITGNDGCGQRCVTMLGRIDDAGEGGAVAAGRAMRRQGLNGVVVPMHDMRDGIQRERQQQGGECDSQPGRRSSG